MDVGTGAPPSPAPLSSKGSIRTLKSRIRTEPYVGGDSWDALFQVFFADSWAFFAGPAFSIEWGVDTGERVVPFFADSWRFSFLCVSLLYRLMMAPFEITDCSGF